MRILKDTFKQLHHLQYMSAATGGGVESLSLPILTARVDSLPSSLDALVLCSDLQGITPSWRHGGEKVLLGIQVAEELLDLADEGMLPAPVRTGVILAGDLYSAPGGNKRGASGDVRDVWLAFSAMNQWVAGVAGNHDRFGTAREEGRLCAEEKIDILDGTLVSKDGLRIGGVGYIIGNPAKGGRREEGEFLSRLDLVLGESPEIVVLHQGPSGARAQRGNAHVRKRIESGASSLVVCGHVHWKEPLAELGNTQVVNVDSRVVILTR